MILETPGQYFICKLIGKTESETQHLLRCYHTTIQVQRVNY
jgi:hypothetical protein